MLHIGCHLSSAKGYLAMGKDAIILNPAQSTTVLLETMAGKGTEIDRSFEELRAIILYWKRPMNLPDMLKKLLC